MLFAIFGQLHFFLQLDSDLAKFIQLFWKALYDMKSFIIIELIIISLMAAVMQVLGTRFDDGGNMDLVDNIDEEVQAYDTNHNDYPFISSFGVSIISAYRNAVGDLQMPTYDYWTAEGN